MEGNMAPTIQEMENRLNQLYWTDSEAYLRQLEMIKGMGFRVFRNSKGKHKVQADMSKNGWGSFMGALDMFSSDFMQDGRPEQ